MERFDVVNFLLLSRIVQKVNSWTLTRKFYTPFRHRPIGPREFLHRMVFSDCSKVELENKIILITGASSGMGRLAALKLAQEGAFIIAIARREHELQTLVKEIKANGGNAAYYSVDITDYDAVQVLIDQVQQVHGVPDIVINNAGRSIRRNVKDAIDRYHDYQRTMAVNYYPAVQLTLGFLPEMIERGSGHFINIASWGVPLHTVPLFSAYLASKSALETFSRSVELDTKKDGIKVTVIYPPLVSTAMTAPTEEYQDFDMLRPETAAELIVFAAKNQPREVIPRLVRYVRFLFTIHPALGELLTSNAQI